MGNNCWEGGVGGAIVMIGEFHSALYLFIQS